MRNSESGIHKIKGSYSISLTSGRSAEDHTLDVEFDINDSNTLSPIYTPDNGGGSNNGRGNIDCGNLVYNGPTEGQIIQFCQTAQLYECLGQTTELEYVCDAIESYGASCPYCD
ncbi:hypothetical protein ULMS_28130 [Patiriisocius marinistellae]|uniref:Uncharacterized protein n=1 Tax=Patiriisocius marinistellae TaxID=2494560 RepID=A0A5J4G3E2_9FLAO|nr:hypothetical protein [Patiriisocius marinistellae]GEQ87305.1 hypothetical protein ULMS_28130 [Patiriisocius marinistellae]